MNRRFGLLWSSIVLLVVLSVVADHEAGHFGTDPTDPALAPQPFDPNRQITDPNDFNTLTLDQQLQYLHGPHYSNEFALQFFQNNPALVTSNIADRFFSGDNNPQVAGGNIVNARVAATNYFRNNFPGEEIDLSGLTAADEFSYDAAGQKFIRGKQRFPLDILKQEGIAGVRVLNDDFKIIQQVDGKQRDITITGDGAGTLGFKDDTLMFTVPTDKPGQPLTHNIHTLGSDAVTLNIEASGSITIEGSAEGSVFVNNEWVSFKNHRGNLQLGSTGDFTAEDALVISNRLYLDGTFEYDSVLQEVQAWAHGDQSRNNGQTIIFHRSLGIRVDTSGQSRSQGSVAKVHIDDTVDWSKYAPKEKPPAKNVQDAARQLREEVTNLPPPQPSNGDNLDVYIKEYPERNSFIVSAKGKGTVQQYDNGIPPTKKIGGFFFRGKDGISEFDARITPVSEDVDIRGKVSYNDRHQDIRTLQDGISLGITRRHNQKSANVEVTCHGCSKGEAVSINRGIVLGELLGNGLARGEEKLLTVNIVATDDGLKSAPTSTFGLLASEIREGKGVVLGESFTLAVHPEGNPVHATSKQKQLFSVQHTTEGVVGRFEEYDTNGNRVGGAPVDFTTSGKIGEPKIIVSDANANAVHSLLQIIDSDDPEKFRKIAQLKFDRNDPQLNNLQDLLKREKGVDISKLTDPSYVEKKNNFEEQRLELLKRGVVIDPVSGAIVEGQDKVTASQKKGGQIAYLVSAVQINFLQAQNIGDPTNAADNRMVINSLLRAREGYDKLNAPPEFTDFGLPAAITPEAALEIREGLPQVGIEPDLEQAKLLGEQVSLFESEKIRKEARIQGLEARLKFLELRNSAYLDIKGTGVNFRIAEIQRARNDINALKKEIQALDETIESSKANLGILANIQTRPDSAALVGAVSGETDIIREYANQVEQIDPGRADLLRVDAHLIDVQKARQEGRREDAAGYLRQVILTGSRGLEHTIQPSVESGNGDENPSAEKIKAIENSRAAYAIAAREDRYRPEIIQELNRKVGLGFIAELHNENTQDGILAASIGAQIASKYDGKLGGLTLAVEQYLFRPSEYLVQGNIALYERIGFDTDLEGPYATIIGEGGKDVDLPTYLDAKARVEEQAFLNTERRAEQSGILLGYFKKRLEQGADPLTIVNELSSQAAQIKEEEALTEQIGFLEERIQDARSRNEQERVAELQQRIQGKKKDLSEALTPEKLEKRQRAIKDAVNSPLFKAIALDVEQGNDPKALREAEAWRALHFVNQERSKNQGKDGRIRGVIESNAERFAGTAAGQQLERYKPGFETRFGIIPETSIGVIDDFTNPTIEQTDSIAREITTEIVTDVSNIIPGAAFAKIGKAGAKAVQGIGTGVHLAGAAVKGVGQSIVQTERVAKAITATKNAARFIPQPVQSAARAFVDTGRIVVVEGRSIIKGAGEVAQNAVANTQRFIGSTSRALADEVDETQRIVDGLESGVPEIQRAKETLENLRRAKAADEFGLIDNAAIRQAEQALEVARNRIPELAGAQQQLEKARQAQFIFQRTEGARKNRLFSAELHELVGEGARVNSQSRKFVDDVKSVISEAQRKGVSVTKALDDAELLEEGTKLASRIDDFENRAFTTRIANIFRETIEKSTTDSNAVVRSEQTFRALQSTKAGFGFTENGELALDLSRVPVEQHDEARRLFSELEESLRQANKNPDEFFREVAGSEIERAVRQLQADQGQAVTEELARQATFGNVDSLPIVAQTAADQASLAPRITDLPQGKREAVLSLIETTPDVDSFSAAIKNPQARAFLQQREQLIGLARFDDVKRLDFEILKLELGELAGRNVDQLKSALRVEGNQLDGLLEEFVRYNGDIEKHVDYQLLRPPASLDDAVQESVTGLQGNKLAEQPLERSPLHTEDTVADIGIPETARDSTGAQVFRRTFEEGEISSGVDDTVRFSDEVKQAIDQELAAFVADDVITVDEARQVIPKLAGEELTKVANVKQTHAALQHGDVLEINNELHVISRQGDQLSLRRINFEGQLQSPRLLVAESDDIARVGVPAISVEDLVQAKARKITQAGEQIDPEQAVEGVIDLVTKRAQRGPQREALADVIDLEARRAAEVADEVIVRRAVGADDFVVPQEPDVVPVVGATEDVLQKELDELKNVYSQQNLESIIERHPAVRVQKASQARITKQLGEGTKGIVFEGSIPGIDDNLVFKAAKVKEGRLPLRGSFVENLDEIFVEFEKAREICRHVPCPAYHGIYDIDGVPYLVSDKIEGIHFFDLTDEQIVRFFTPEKIEKMRADLLRVAEEGWDSGDIQAMVLTKSQKLGGTQYQAGDVVFIDVAEWKFRSSRFEGFADDVQFSLEDAMVFPLERAKMALETKQKYPFTNEVENIIRAADKDQLANILQEFGHARGTSLRISVEPQERIRLILQEGINPNEIAVRLTGRSLEDLVPAAKLDDELVDAARLNPGVVDEARLKIVRDVSEIAPNSRVVVQLADGTIVEGKYLGSGPTFLRVDVPGEGSKLISKNTIIEVNVLEVRQPLDEVVAAGHPPVLSQTAASLRAVPDAPSIQIEIQIADDLKILRSGYAEQAETLEAILRNYPDVDVEKGARVVLRQKAGEGTVGIVFEGTLDELENIVFKTAKSQSGEKSLRGTFAANIDELFLEYENALGACQYIPCPFYYGFYDVEGIPFLAIEKIEGKHFFDLTHDEIVKYFTPEKISKFREDILRAGEAGWLPGDLQAFVVTKRQTLGGVPYEPGDIVFLDFAEWRHYEQPSDAAAWADYWTKQTMNGRLWAVENAKITAQNFPFTDDVARQVTAADKDTLHTVLLDLLPESNSKEIAEYLAYNARHRMEALLEFGINPNEIAGRLGKSDDSRAVITSQQVLRTEEQRQLTRQQLFREIPAEEGGRAVKDIKFNDDLIRRIDYDVADRNYALQKALITENPNLRTLQNGAYNYVILDDGTLVVGKVDDTLQLGVKHNQLANNQPVKVSGELFIDSQGNYFFNVESSFTRNLETKGFKRTELEQRIDEIFTAEFGNKGLLSKQKLTPDAPPSVQQLREICAGEVVVLYKNLCASVDIGLNAPARNVDQQAALGATAKTDSINRLKKVKLTDLWDGSADSYQKALKLNLDNIKDGDILVIDGRLQYLSRERSSILGLKIGRIKTYLNKFDPVTGTIQRKLLVLTTEEAATARVPAGLAGVESFQDIIVNELRGAAHTGQRIANAEDASEFLAKLVVQPIQREEFFPIRTPLQIRKSDGVIVSGRFAGEDDGNIVLLKGDGSIEVIPKTNLGDLQQISAEHLLLKQKIAAGGRVKGEFEELLFTHNVPVQLMEAIFKSGSIDSLTAAARNDIAKGLVTHEQVISALKNGERWPIERGYIKRGANFRYGLDSEFGEIKMVMKRGFERKYKGYDDVSQRVTDEAFFNDFFEKAETFYGRKMTPDELKLKIAQDYEFRKYLDDLPAGQDFRAGREAFERTYLNPQLQITEQVTLDDVAAILVPDHLYDEVISIARKNDFDVNRIRRIEGTGLTNEYYAFNDALGIGSRADAAKQGVARPSRVPLASGGDLQGSSSTLATSKKAFELEEAAYFDIVADEKFGEFSVRAGSSGAPVISVSLQEVLQRSVNTDGRELIQLFFDEFADLQPLLAADAGVREGYTVAEHSRRVFSQLNDQLSFYELNSLRVASDVDVEALLRTTIPLHDIGKPKAVEVAIENFRRSLVVSASELQKAGLTVDQIRVIEQFRALSAQQLEGISSIPLLEQRLVSLGYSRESISSVRSFMRPYTDSLQHQFTAPILQEKLQKLGFSANEIRIANTLVTNDVLGDLAKGTISQQDALLQLQLLAQRADMPLEDYYRLQMLFYVSDASSYPALLQNVFIRERSGRLVVNRAEFVALENVLFRERQAVVGNAVGVNLDLINEHFINSGYVATG